LLIFRIRFQTFKNYMTDFALDKKIIVCTYTHIVLQLQSYRFQQNLYIINQHTFQYLFNRLLYSSNSNVEKYILFKK